MDIMEFIKTEYKWFATTFILFIGLLVAIRQLRSINRQLQANSLHQIQANDREIKTLRFNNPLIFGNDINLNDEERLKLYYYMNLLIHHAKHIFIQNELKAIPKEYWEAVDLDMKMSITDSSFLNEWNKVRNYMPDSFRLYVENLKR